MSLIRKHGAVLQAWACLDLVSTTYFITLHWYEMGLWNFSEWFSMFFEFLGWSASCSASDIAYWYIFLHSIVCPLSLCLSHSLALLKPLDGFKCHLVGTLVGFNDTLCRWGLWPPRGRGDLRVEPSAKTGSCKLHAVTWRIETRSCVD